MRKVRIIPKSHRAKNRVNEHGEVMELLMTNQYDKTVLVKSLDRTFNGLTGKEHWLGWFHEDDAKIEEL